MANTQETIADILAWLRRPREGENAYLTLWRDEIADRLESAHKREVAVRSKLYGLAGSIHALIARSDARERGIHYTEVQNIAAQIENIANGEV